MHASKSFARNATLSTSKAPSTRGCGGCGSSTVRGAQPMSDGGVTARQATESCGSVTIAGEEPGPGPEPEPGGDIPWMLLAALGAIAAVVLSG